MLKRQALKKMLITSLTIVILLMIYIMPTAEESTKKLNTVPKVEYTENEVGYIYLMNDSDLLVRVDFLIGKYNNIEEQVKQIINNLISNSTSPKELRNIIPKKTKLNSLNFKDGILTLNFSKDILTVEEKYQEKIIESISFSVFEIKEINSVNILVEDENINKYFKSIPDNITRQFGINKKYDIKSLKKIQKVVVYYINEIENKNYFVPVTSYINDEEEKVKIIIQNLSSNYIFEPNLKSLLNSNTELINYEIKDDMMNLNFNNSIFINGNILEEVIYTISNSIFDSYDVNKITFNVENKVIKEVTK